VVRGDRTRLVQVLVNLLGNAVKYSPAGSRIELRVESSGGLAAVSVRDEGVGIDAGFLPHVFELFTQARRTPDRSQGGLGIGLALVKSLVEMHGGQVTAASAGAGRGSAFTFTLPLSAAGTAAAPSTEPVERVDAAPGAGGLRIMVVDDNVDAGETLASLLELEGHVVRVALDAEVALEIAPGFGAQAFILDIGLPRMDGYELARRLRADASVAPATYIALTGYGQERDRERTRAAGFDVHLVKPVDPTMLQEILQRLGTEGESADVR
jgi:CheY-like chemotaxis protein/anti-sigma regulatory factor (Ser/Thr protein kinase)